MERRIRKDRHPLFKLRAEHSMSLFYCPMLGQGEKIMGKFIDLTGEKFGKWTVLRYVEKSKWLCKCECGVEKDVAGATQCDTELHCHHVMPYSASQIYIADPDACITLCKSCHLDAHRKNGCRYTDLHKKECAK